MISITSFRQYTKLVMLPLFIVFVLSAIIHSETYGFNPTNNIELLAIFTSTFFAGFGIIRWIEYCVSKQRF